MRGKPSGAVCKDILEFDNRIIQKKENKMGRKSDYIIAIEAIHNVAYAKNSLGRILNSLEKLRDEVEHEIGGVEADIEARKNIFRKGK